MWRLRLTVIRKNQSAPLIGKLIGMGLVSRPMEYVVEHYAMDLTVIEADFFKANPDYLNGVLSAIAKKANKEEALGIEQIIVAGWDRV